MLHSKVVHCPEKPDDIAVAAAPFAEMAMDYAIELGIGKTLYNTQGFILDWMRGKKFVIGIYDKEDLVGMITGTITFNAFTDAKVMTVQTAYLRREYRTHSDAFIVDAFSTARAFAKSIEADTLFLHADPRMAKPLKKYGGTVSYVAIQFDIGGA